MATRAKEIRPSDLPTKTVRAPDGSPYSMKVVQAESPTFAQDMLAAFRWNVTRIRADQKLRANDQNDAKEA